MDLFFLIVAVRNIRGAEPGGREILICGRQLFSTK